MDRRTFLKLSGAGVVVLGSGLSLTGCGPPPLGSPDQNGLRLQAGFTSRKIATSNQVVPGTSYTWHGSPDGGAVFPTGDGGWIYVSNAELVAGGASMVRFDTDGTIVDAKRILSGTLANCAGGATPWGTWLSCEEYDKGRVWECDPYGVATAVVRPQMGAFRHEAAAVDDVGQAIYLTEDDPLGAFYRFRPTTWGDLSAGVLEVMTEIAGTLTWAPVPDANGLRTTNGTATRDQVPGTKRFKRAEGTIFVNGSVCFTTTTDNKVWRYTPSTNALVVVYDAGTSSNAILTGVDNITALPNGDLFVAEDGGDMDIVRIRPNGTLERLLNLSTVTGSEITGPAFSPDHTRLYFSSQRNPGVTFEVSGSF